jgi:hypothetical protein
MSVVLPQVYLMGGFVARDGSILPGSVIPLADVFVMLDAQDAVDQLDEKEISDVNKKALSQSCQLYLTDNVGRISNFSTGQFSESGEDIFAVGGKIDVLSSAQVIPPKNS